MNRRALSEFASELTFPPGGAHSGEFDGIVALAATLCDAPIAFSIWGLGPEVVAVR